MTTGEKIKELRKQKGLTQEELGRLVGVQKAAINKYETGIVVNIKKDVLVALGKALDVSPVYLLNDEPGITFDEWDSYVRSVSEIKPSPDELLLIKDYRSLTPAGRDYVDQQIVIAKTMFKEE